MQLFSPNSFKIRKIKLRSRDYNSSRLLDRRGGHQRRELRFSESHVKVPPHPRAKLKEITHVNGGEAKEMMVFTVVATVLTTAWIFCLSDENTRADMKKLPTLPTKVLKEHPSLAYWYVSGNLDLINAVIHAGLCCSSSDNELTCRNWSHLVGTKWVDSRYVLANQSFIKGAVGDVHLTGLPEK